MLTSKFQPLKERFQQLAPREQKIVKLGSRFVVLFIVYQFIWTPLIEKTDYLHKQIVTQGKTLASMQELDKKIQAVEKNHKEVKEKVVTPVALLSILHAELKQHKLLSSVKELKQTSNETVSVTLKKVSFDEMMRLLLNLQEKHRVLITQLSVIATTTPGLVDMTIQL